MRSTSMAALIATALSEQTNAFKDFVFYTREKKELEKVRDKKSHHVQNRVKRILTMDKADQEVTENLNFMMEETKMMFQAVKEEDTKMMFQAVNDGRHKDVSPTVRHV